MSWYRVATITGLGVADMDETIADFDRMVGELTAGAAS